MDALTPEIEATIIELRAAGRFEDLAVELFTAAHDEYDESIRIAILERLADVFEQDIADPESALVTMSAALRADYGRTATLVRIDRLAEQCGAFEALVVEYGEAANAVRPVLPTLANQIDRIVDHWRSKQTSQ